MPPRKRKKCAARRSEVIDEPERVEGVNMVEDEGGEANQSHTPQEKCLEVLDKVIQFQHYW